jgi:hypothetical protein
MPSPTSQCDRDSSAQITYPGRLSLICAIHSADPWYFFSPVDCFGSALVPGNLWRPKDAVRGGPRRPRAPKPLASLTTDRPRQKRKGKLARPAGSASAPARHGRGSPASESDGGQSPPEPEPFALCGGALSDANARVRRAIQSLSESAARPSVCFCSPWEPIARDRGCYDPLSVNRRTTISIERLLESANFLVDSQAVTCGAYFRP